MIKAIMESGRSPMGFAHGQSDYYHTLPLSIMIPYRITAKILTLTEAPIAYPPSRVSLRQPGGTIYTACRLTSQQG